MDKYNSWKNKEKIADQSPSSPPVNFINITRRPEGGILNVEMKRQPGGKMELNDSGSFFKPSSMPNMFADFDDPFFNRFKIKSLLKQHQDDFDKLSMNSSSFEEKPPGDESTQSRLVINPSNKKDGGVGNVHKVIIHPRSQSSDDVIVATNTKDSGDILTTAQHMIGPKASSTGNISFLETKFPSSKNSFFGQKPFFISPSSFFSESRPSLFDRFNEHAPPSFFDTKFRSQSNPENNYVSKVTVMREAGQKPKVHSIPIKIERREGDSGRGKPSVVYKIPINLVNRPSEQDRSSQPPLPIQVSLKPKGVSIPIITHKSTNSEAEEKLTQLTKQLEEELKKTGVSKQKQHQTEEAPQVVPPKKFFSESSKIFKPKVSLPQEKKEEDLERENKQEVKELPVPQRVDEIASKKNVKNEEKEEKEEDHLFGPCYECGEDVMRGACLALGRLYHHTCFKCSVCSCELMNKTFYMKKKRQPRQPIHEAEEVIFCHTHFQEEKEESEEERCDRCFQPITDLIIKIGDEKWHDKCFKCCKCFQPLKDKKFTFNHNHLPICIHDYWNTKCFFCNKPIKPDNDEEDEVKEVVVNGNHHYHVDCFKCLMCNKTLDETVENGAYGPSDSSSSSSSTLIFCKKCCEGKKIS